MYLQSVIDCYSRDAWGRLYTDKLPVTAVHVRNNDVLPTFEAHQASIRTVLSDNGREYCGCPDNYPYELYLQLANKEHRATKAPRPQSNGFIERLHRTLLNEHYQVQRRATWYETLDEIQKNLDSCLRYCKQASPDQRRNMKG